MAPAPTLARAAKRHKPPKKKAIPKRPVRPAIVGTKNSSPPAGTAAVRAIASGPLLSAARAASYLLTAGSSRGRAADSPAELGAYAASGASTSAPPSGGGGSSPATGAGVPIRNTNGGVYAAGSPNAQMQAGEISSGAFIPARAPVWRPPGYTDRDVIEGLQARGLTGAEIISIMDPNGDSSPYGQAFAGRPIAPQTEAGPGGGIPPRGGGSDPNIRYRKR